jgi:copper transport protein
VPADTATPSAEQAVPPPPPDAFDAESPLYAAVRWLGFAALLALTGSAGFGLLVAPAAARRGLSEAIVPTIDARARALGLASAALLLVAMVLRLAAQSAASHGAGRAPDAALLAPLLTGTTWGTGWLVQLAAAAVALTALVVALGGRTRAWPVVAAGAALACVGGALSGHAVAVEDRLALAVGVHALHALAAGGWLGTLLVLVLGALPIARRLPADERGRAVAHLVNAYSPWALAFALTVVATGAASAWLHLDAPSALWSSAYGRTLLVKLALLAPVLAVGAYNWRRVRPALGDATGAVRLGRSATAELAFAALVLAVTAVLVATPPDVLP